MKILVIEPEKAPYEKEIGDDIHDMQAIVGGCIEPIYFEPKETAIAWCNDEFLLNGSQPNRIVGNVLVHGTFFVSGNYMNEYGWRECLDETNTANGTAVHLPMIRSRNIPKCLKLPLSYWSKCRLRKLR